jgi:hypothetical protein
MVRLSSDDQCDQYGASPDERCLESVPPGNPGHVQLTYDCYSFKFDRGVKY